MDLQLLNAVSHVILRGLVISEMNFEICHRIRKKRYRSCPGVIGGNDLHIQNYMGGLGGEALQPPKVGKFWS